MLKKCMCSRGVHIRDVCVREMSELDTCLSDLRLYYLIWMTVSERCQC